MIVYLINKFKPKYAKVSPLTKNYDAEIIKWRSWG